MPRRNNRPQRHRATQPHAIEHGPTTYEAMAKSLVDRGLATLSILESTVRAERVRRWRDG